MRKQKVCQKCGEKIAGKSLNNLLCRKCIRSLPQCYVCGIICGAKEWGYNAEPIAIPCILKKTSEKVFLCGSCNKDRLRRNKTFILDKSQKIPAEEIEAVIDEREAIKTILS